MISLSNEKTKVWYITGASSGIGLELTKHLLKNGDKVIGTSRDCKRFNSIENLINNPNFFGVQVDIISKESVEESVKLGMEKFGCIDVLVNNAGYAQVGCVEELTDKEHRDAMDVLYFGPLNVIRCVLPHFRERKSGFVYNVASTCGIKAYGRMSAYNSPKFAMVAMSECLSEEVKPLGIKVSCLVLGYFKTEFQNNFSFPSQMIQDYDTKTYLTKLNGIMNSMVPSDMNKFTQLLIDNQKLENPPHTLYIGSDAFYLVDEKIKYLEEQYKVQKDNNSCATTVTTTPTTTTTTPNINP